MREASRIPDDLDLGDPEIWKTLTHAYGSAGAGPRDLSWFFDPDKNVREDAKWVLYGTFYHQGTRYTSSVFVIPILYRMIVHPACIERAWLIQYLVHIGLSYTREAFLPAAPPPAVLRARFAAQEAAATHDRYGVPSQVARECYDAVSAGAPQLLPFLADPDPQVRINTAFTLAMFADHAEKVAPRLAEAVADPDRAVRISAILSLAALERAVGKDDRAPLLTPLLADEDPAISAAAALALADGERVRTIAEPLTRVLTGWRDALGETDFERLEKWSAAPGYAVRQIRAACSEPEAVWVDVFVSALAKVGESQSVGLTRELLLYVGRSAVEDAPSGRREETARDLTPLQRRALEGIVEHGAFGNGSSYGNYVEVIKEFGLPGNRDALRAWLAV